MHSRFSIDFISAPFKSFIWNIQGLMWKACTLHNQMVSMASEQGHEITLEWNTIWNASDQYLYL